MKMRMSPRKSKITKKGNVAPIGLRMESLGQNEFKIYASGRCINLDSKEQFSEWVNVCNIRYYDHLAMDPNYDKSILVIWEDENGERPKEHNDGKFDLEKMKILKLEINFHKENNKYSRI